MLYRYEYIYENEVLKVMGDDADKIIMNEMCHKFAEMLPQSVKLEITDYDNKYSEWHHGKLYKAEVHCFHPDEMDKVRDALREIRELRSTDNLSYHEVYIRVNEIAQLLGFTKPKA